MWLSLIPVRGGSVIVGQLVGVPVLNRDPDRLLEEDRVFDVVAIDRVLAAPRPVVRALVEDQPMIRRAVFLLRTEGRIEVVFRAGAVQTGPGRAVDEDHVVAFAVPVVGLAREAVDVHVAADVVAAPFRLQDDVIVLAGDVGRAPCLAHQVMRCPPSARQGLPSPASGSPAATGRGSVRSRQAGARRVLS